MTDISTVIVGHRLASPVYNASGVMCREIYELEAVRHRFDDAFDVATEEELERVLQRHGQADGDDHLLHGADVASA